MRVEERVERGVGARGGARGRWGGVGWGWSVVVND